MNVASSSKHAGSPSAPGAWSEWVVVLLGVYAVATLISMAVMSIAILTVILAAVVVVASCPRGELRLAELARKPEMRGYFVLALALTFACAASLVGAKIDPLVYDGKHAEVHFLRDMAKTWYLFWPLPLAWLLTRLGADGRAKVVRAWVIAFGALAVLGIAQHFTGWPRPQQIPTDPTRFHVTGFLGHHLSVASIYIFPYFVALDQLRSRERRPLGIPRAALWAIVLIGTATLFLTYSRALWVALPIGILAWIAFSAPRRVVIAACALAAVLAVAASQLPFVQTRVHDPYGWITRADLWRANLEFFKARPLTGTGWHHNLELSGYYFHQLYPGQSQFFTGHAHDDALEMLGGTGILGFLAWLAWSAGAFYWAWPRGPRSGRFSRGIFCAWIVFQLNGITQVNFWESKVLHQMMWVTALVLAERADRSRSEEHALA